MQKTGHMVSIRKIKKKKKKKSNPNQYNCLWATHKNIRVNLEQLTGSH